MHYDGDLVYWVSTLQKSVMLSSDEAELYAASEATRPILFLRYLAKEWNFPVQSVTKLRVDTTCALAMTVANGPTKKSKHSHSREVYVIEQVERKNVDAYHV